MRIAICDDDSGHSKVLYKVLSGYSKTKDAEFTVYDDPNALASDITDGAHYEIAFLDIDMPQMSGIDLAKKIKEQSGSTFIVFITSYPQYAISAFDCEAFHYLLKPIEVDKLIAVIDKIFIKHLKQRKYHLIKIKTASVRIPINDLYYIECCRKHIIYHLKDREYETTETLSEVYAALKDYGFYQVHQGFLVNMDKIDRFDRQTVILVDGSEVMLSTRKRTDVIFAYSKYLEEHI